MAKQYTWHYDSPLGGILLSADELGLTGLWFDGQKYYARILGEDREEKWLPIFEQTVSWLDIYFSGRNPDFEVPQHLIGSRFQKAVWKILRTIPYGETRTYGEVAEILAHTIGKERMAARAVGGAVGHNDISIIIPCHRVVGKGGSLTGYAGGVDRKRKLLELEKAI